MINLKSNESNIKVALSEEILFLQDYLKSQQKLNTDIHILLKESVNSTIIVNLSHSKCFTEELSEYVKLFKKSTSNIANLENLLSKVNKLDTSSDEFEKNLEKYNNLYTKLFDEIVKNSIVIENFIKNETNNLENNNINNSQIHLVENTLIISEVDDKVVLPYTVEDLNKELVENPNKYNNLEDIVNTIYTKPFKYYNNSSSVRFKEAFKLVREREHGTFFQALDLAFELFSNYNLHPAVITACKDLNELDVYLSCLEYNELDDFHFFKTIFKFRPTKMKTSKT